MPEKVSSIDQLELPRAVKDHYISIGTTDLFPWQSECLSIPQVLDGANLVIQAPTSAGKTLVAEVIALRGILEGRKALFVLPFVSVVREKVISLQRFFLKLGLRVAGYLGGMTPPGGVASWDLAICTIEKANGLINKLLDQQILHNTIGTIIIDEIHMVADEGRGYLLEVMISKILSLHKELRNPDAEMKPIQIVGMSATLSNGSTLASWLDAQFYQTSFRPVTLEEHIIYRQSIFSESFHQKRMIPDDIWAAGGSDPVISLCLETVSSRQSVIVFTNAKWKCEKLTGTISQALWKILSDKKSGSPWAQGIKAGISFSDQKKFLLSFSAISDIKESVMAKSLLTGVCFHHAGLTMEEREMIEKGFKSGLIRVIVATSTLSAGVNLPVRRVVLDYPWKKPGQRGPPGLSPLLYRQMIGRAGRTGIDTEGISFHVLNIIPNRTVIVAIYDLKSWYNMIEKMEQHLKTL